MSENVSREQNPSAVVKWAFVIGITLLANLFVAYLTQALYPSPQYDDFCPAVLTGKFIDNPKECTEVGGEWYPDMSSETQGYCNATATCQKEYMDVQEVYTRNVFLVFVVFGALLLVASAFLSAAPVIALGSSFAGVLALVIGSIWHWSAMQEWLRVIVLGAALVGVVYLAWKKFGPNARSV